MNDQKAPKKARSAPAESPAHLRVVKTTKAKPRGPKPVSPDARQRTLEDMVDRYVERALAAREKQGLPPTVRDRGFLNKVSRWMTDDLARFKEQETHPAEGAA